MVPSWMAVSRTAASFVLSQSSWRGAAPKWVKKGASRVMLGRPCRSRMEAVPPWCREPASQSGPGPRHEPKTVAAALARRALTAEC